MHSNKSETLAGIVAVTFSSSDDAVKASIDTKVMADVVALVASEQNKLAIELLDQGNVEACRKTLEDNTRFLSINALQLRSKSLEKDAFQNSIQLKELEGVTSNAAPGAVRSRKVARDYELKADQQSTKP